MPKESLFSAQIRTTIKEKWGQKVDVHLIPDAPMSGNKPYDAFFVLKSKHYALEFKMATGLSINFDKVTDNQIATLTACDKAGGKAWLLVWFVREEAAVAIDIKLWIDIVHELRKLGYKSVKYKYFLQELYKESKIDKDFRGLIEIIHKAKIGRKKRWEVQKLVPNKKKVRKSA